MEYGSKCEIKSIMKDINDIIFIIRRILKDYLKELSSEIKSNSESFTFYLDDFNEIWWSHRDFHRRWRGPACIKLLNSSGGRTRYLKKKFGSP